MENITHLLSAQLDLGKIRTYTLNGIELFSVTSVLQALQNDPQIEMWRAKVGDEAANAVLDKARERGTYIHLMIENHYLGKVHPIPLDDEKILACYTGFNTFIARHGHEITPSEINGTPTIECELLDSEYGIGGKYDMIAMWDGKLTMIDFKTSSGSRLTGLTLEKYKMQVAAYAYMFSMATGKKIEQFKIVPLTYSKKDGLGHIETIDNEDEMFECLKNFFVVLDHFKKLYSLT